MTTKVTAPSRTTAVHSFGPVALSFTDGVAEADDLPSGVRAYMERRGYTITTPRKRKTKEASDVTGPENTDR